MKHACVQTLWLVQMRFARSQKGASAPGRAPGTRKQHDFEQTTGNSGLAVALPLRSCITLSPSLYTLSQSFVDAQNTHTNGLLSVVMQALIFITVLISTCVRTRSHSLGEVQAREIP